MSDTGSTCMTEWCSVTICDTVDSSTLTETAQVSLGETMKNMNYIYLGSRSEVGRTE